MSNWSIQEYGIHEYHKLAIIWTRVWFACFQKPKSCMIPDKPYIGTQYGADYGKPRDHYLLFDSSYNE